MSKLNKLRAYELIKKIREAHSMFTSAKKILEEETIPGFVLEHMDEVREGMRKKVKFLVRFLRKNKCQD